MAASILAINVAGTKVTSPASYSTAHIGQAADISGPDSTLGAGAGGNGTGGDSATTGLPYGTDPAGGAAGSGPGSRSGGAGPYGSGSPGSGTPTTDPSPDRGAPGTSTTTTPSSPPTTGSPGTTEAPPPSSVQSVTVTGGTVRVQCIGDTATLLADPPASGFQAEASYPSAGTVHVEFTNGSVSSEVNAVCANGVITFHTETSTDG